MSTRKVWFGTLALTLAGLTALHAQAPTGPYGGGPKVMSDAEGKTPPVASARTKASLSEWITGSDPDCCGPLTDGNPMRTELFLRSGISLIDGDGPLANSLDDGWLIEGGGRALFFNDRGDSAWAIDLGITNIHNNAGNPQPVTLNDLRVTDPNFGNITIPQQTVNVRALNRTFVNLGGGIEWYLLGGAYGTRDTCDPAVWRFGIDGGGRWGTCKAEFFEIRRRTDTIAGAYAAVHSDVEWLCGPCVFMTGVRGEWSYTWSDVLQIQNNSDVRDINVTLSAGIRY